MGSLGWRGGERARQPLAVASSATSVPVSLSWELQEGVVSGENIRAAPQARFPRGSHWGCERLPKGHFLHPLLLPLNAVSPKVTMGSPLSRWLTHTLPFDAGHLAGRGA